MNLKKKFIWFFATLFPHFFVNKAYAILSKPSQFKLLQHERDILAQSKASKYKFKDFNIQCYKWGTGKKKILMVHGWEGHAGNFSKLISILVEKNYSIFAFDGPSHGASTRGKTSVFDFVNLVEELIKFYKINQIVSHSFGGVAAIGALARNPKIQIEKYVAFTIPNKFSDRIFDVSDKVGLPYNVVKKLIKKIEKKENVNIKDLNVEDFAKQASINKALILHDVKDRILPFKISKEFSKKWDIAELIEIRNTGHYKILNDPISLKKTVSFLVT